MTSYAQKSTVGIALYPTGTETGLGFRSGKNSRFLLDARVTKANLYSDKKISSFITEVSGVCRVVKLEKVRFHLGLGLRNEWNYGGKLNKIGAVLPVGVEAFPFPFQNAGLFFETAPFYTQDTHNVYYAGIRTVAGFVFYFPVKEEKKSE
jgi:hypothetical protein